MSAWGATLRRAGALVCLAVGMSVGAGLGADSASRKSDSDPSLRVLLDRAAWYLDFFVDQFENVVAEETYLQDSTVLLPTFVPTGGRGTMLAQPSAADTARARHRDLRSDFLLVKSPQTEALMPFRDVIEVDGLAVRDREQRLATLFLDPSKDAMTLAEQIREEGARYNLGNMRSTIGNPVLALGILQPSYQSRFHFSLRKDDKAPGSATTVVDYKEISSPAMVRGEAGADLFAHGRLWIETATGRVLRTELLVEQPTIRAVVTTTFRLDDRFGIAVPQEMRERYSLGSGNRISTVATYGRFRRFDVRADEELHLPTRTLADESSGMTFVEIPPGRFTMGSASSEAGRNEDEVLHDVTITKPFYLARFEVTQQEWRNVMATSPSQFATCGARCPVENVSFFDVQQFLAKLNGLPSRKLVYRLPSEAEWEYACRAGTTGPFSTGETVTTAQANFNGLQPYTSSPVGQFRQRPLPVGSFPLNPWGLSDMHGNVWEWTADWYGPYREGVDGAIDPHGPPAGEKRVIRGGSWFFDANSARCALRYTHSPKDRGYSLGFRVAADPLR
jgi:sulfatase modifying factor 1